MNPTATCPSHPEVERILRGEVPAEAAAFADHLEQCEACGATVERLLSADPLLEAMRGLKTVPGVAGTDAPALRQPLLSTAGSEPDNTQGLPSAQRYGFLPAPQGAGELGRLGQYRVLKVLGRGGMGVVFQAEDVRLKRMVALKVIRPEVADKPGVRERFLREAQAAAALEHQNIVPVYQVDEADGVPFLAMPWLKGMSLEERLRQTGPFTAAQVVRLGQQVARGLAAAHEAGLVHRDIKPANLWLEGEPGALATEGRIKILDFGLAAGAGGDPGLTQSGTILGTLSYMAPEQARGHKVSPRSDLFSLGVVLYRLCTGHLPFQGDNALEVVAALALSDPTPVEQFDPAVPPALAALVMQLLAKDPNQRPASAREVADRLEAIGRQLATPAPPPEALPAPARRRWRAGAVAAVGLATLLPLGYLRGGAVVRYATNRGVLVVQVDDPTVEVAIKQGGAVVRDPSTQREFVLTAGAGEVEVFEKASGLKLATRKFTLTRGGRETLVVQLEGGKRPARDADRRAAEWVLSIGGRVVIRARDREREIGPGKRLPAGPFQLVQIDLRENDKVSDAGLRRLRGLSGLTHLHLGCTPVSDAGLAHLAGLSSLTMLWLGGTQVGDAGLVHLAGMSRLMLLCLFKTRVSDAGLARLERLSNLRTLWLGHTLVGDAGLAAHLEGLSRLTALGLNGTQVSDAGLAHLEGLSDLTWLDLRGMRIGDPGLAKLHALTRLRDLDLAGSPVSAAGIAAARKALPQCRIHGELAAR
jgi:hypothetical protein